MAKHSSDKQGRVLSKAEKERIKNIEKFDELTPKALKFIGECLEAVIPCSYCNIKDGVIFAAKFDEEGKCIKCHNTKVLPDQEARKWATEEVMSRTAPKPKAMEVEVDDKRNMEDMADKVKDLPDDVVMDLAKRLGVEFEESIEKTTSEPGQDSTT